MALEPQGSMLAGFDVTLRDAICCCVESDVVDRLNGDVSMLEETEAVGLKIAECAGVFCTLECRFELLAMPV